APIIYYGTEIGVDRTKSTTIPKNIYPNGRNYNNEPLNRFSSILSHLPMPWDVQLADENDNVTLQLVRKLISLRQNPAFQWGTYERIKIDQEDCELIDGFVRKATGFPSFITVLIDIDADCIFNLTSVCPSVTPRLVFPSVENIPVNKTLSSSRISVKFDEDPIYVLVFECT
ncbi:hypothetical protein MN116_008990, partial [Schistosoma mekongi]